MKNEVSNLQEENKNLKDKVCLINFNSAFSQINEMTLMLYQKIEENSQLHKKLEQVQMQQQLFFTQMLNLNPNAPHHIFGHGSGIN